MRSTLTGHEAAEYLGISYWLILELAKRGEIPHIRAGRLVLFRTETLDRWLAEQEENSIRKSNHDTLKKIRRIL